MRRPAEWARDSMCKVGASVGVFLPICHGNWALLGPLHWMSDLQMLRAELAKAQSPRSSQLSAALFLAFLQRSPSWWCC